MVGDEYGIADIAVFPWVRNLVGFYGAGELVGFGEFAQVQRVLDASWRALRSCAGSTSRNGTRSAQRAAPVTSKRRRTRAG